MSLRSTPAFATSSAAIAAGFTEAQLQSSVLELATRAGWLGYHTHDARRSQPGFPDLVLIRGTRVLWRELKTQTGRIRPEQQTWLDALTAAGQDAAIWRPSDWLDGSITRALTSTTNQTPSNQ